MKFKKIIKGIVGIGVVGGVAYLAYKIGDGNGEINERFRDKYGDEDDDDIELEEDDDFRFYDNLDEPDDGCIAPANCVSERYSVKDLQNISSFEEHSSDDKRNFVPLSAIRTVPEPTAKSLLLRSVTRGFITNKVIRESLGISMETADEIVAEFQAAGYLGKEQGGNHRIPALLSFSDFVELLRECRD